MVGLGGSLFSSFFVRDVFIIFLVVIVNIAVSGIFGVFGVAKFGIFGISGARRMLVGSSILSILGGVDH